MAEESVRPEPIDIQQLSVGTVVYHIDHLDGDMPDTKESVAELAREAALVVVALPDGTKALIHLDDGRAQDSDGTTVMFQRFESRQVYRTLREALVPVFRDDAAYMEKLKACHATILRFLPEVECQP